MSKLAFYWDFRRRVPAPGSLLLRLILRPFRHEIRWCVSKKVSGCWFLALEAGWLQQQQQQQQPSAAADQRQHQQLPPAAAVKIRFLLGFQKRRSSPRGACYCDWFCVLFGTKLGGVLPFWVCSKKVSGCWFLALEAGWLQLQQQPPAAAPLAACQNLIWFLVGLQKGRSSPRGACYCDWFCVLFGTNFAVSGVFRKRCLAVCFLL